MNNWDEVRTAYHVARAGTVSGAADALGVHHATVIRHVDALEGRLGVKLFQRHGRGYTATEAGEDLLRVARATDEQFAQLESRIKGRGSEVSGELVITALAELSRRLSEVLVDFQQTHPDLKIRLIASDRVFKLEYGEAHVAVRAGREAPSEPDNVVQKLTDQPFALYASQIYIARHGLPESEADLSRHLFVGPENPASRAPYAEWLRQNVAPQQMVFQADDFRAREAAILAGAGMGFLTSDVEREAAGMVEIMPPRDEWAGRLWVVTHMDLHRSAKVQAFVNHLKLWMIGDKQA